jgi:hypothetical protein
MSGIGGQGGTDDFNTYFVLSGTGQGAHSSRVSSRLSRLSSLCLSLSSRLSSFSLSLSSRWTKSETLFFGQPHGFGLWHTLHPSKSSNLSTFALELPNKYPIRRTTDNATNKYVISIFIRITLLLLNIIHL